MILVTGATGLLGAHLLYDLISQGEKIRVLRRQSSSIENIKFTFNLYSKNADSLLKKIEWVEGDMLDYDSLEEALVGIKKVYHCAALVSFQAKEKALTREINIEGTRNLVNLCVDMHIEKFCFVSSIAALGTPENPLHTIDEELKWSPEKKRSNYSLSKFESELEVWRAMEEGLNAVIVNPSVILGAGNWDKGSSKIFSSIKKGLKYFTRGITGYVYVRDVSKAMIMLMNSDISNQRFIVNEGNYSFEEIFKSISKALNIKVEQKYASKYMTEIAWRLSKFTSIISGKDPILTKETARSAHKIGKYSNEKIKSTLGFEFTPIHDAITEIAKHLNG